MENIACTAQTQVYTKEGKAEIRDKLKANNIICEEMQIPCRQNEVKYLKTTWNCKVT